jgi:hypothetical protein
MAEKSQSGSNDVRPIYRWAATELFGSAGDIAAATRTYRHPSQSSPLDIGHSVLDIGYSTSGLPDVFSGLPLLEASEDGVTNTYAYAIGAYDSATRAFT